MAIEEVHSGLHILNSSSVLDQHGQFGLCSGHSVQTFSIILLHDSVFLTLHSRSPLHMAVPAAPPAAPGRPPAGPCGPPAGPCGPPAGPCGPPAGHCGPPAAPDRPPAGPIGPPAAPTPAPPAAAPRKKRAIAAIVSFPIACSFVRFPVEGQKTYANALAGRWSNIYDCTSSGCHFFVVTLNLLHDCHILCGLRAPNFYEIVAILVCQIKVLHIGILQWKNFLQAVKKSDTER